MTDVTQGADAPDDSALFNEVVSTETLAKFENPPAPPAAPEAPAAPAAAERPTDQQRDDNAPVPPGRLREEAENRRRAERERDELRLQLDAMRRFQQPLPQRQQQEAPPQIDLLENPQGFVQAQLRPYLDEIHQTFQQQREAMSLDFAMQRHGNEMVGAARQSLEQGMQRGDPHAWSTYNRAMQSHDPYGVIVRAHQESETLRTIGGDLDGYRKRVLEEALADPAYRARVMEAAKSQAAASGQHVARAPNGQFAPAPAVRPASSPSLANIGAGGGDAQVIEPTDAELFRAATSAKRR